MGRLFNEERCPTCGKLICEDQKTQEIVKRGKEAIKRLRLRN